MIIYCDGGARGNPGPAAAAFIAFAGQTTPEGNPRGKCGKYLGTATNNVAEYRAVICAWEWLVNSRPETGGKMLFRLDSSLVVNQLSGRFKVKNPALKYLHAEVVRLTAAFGSGTAVSYEYIPRGQNERADFLVNQTLDQKPLQ